MWWRRGDSASARSRLWGGLRDDGTGPASQGGVSIAVHEVKYQSDQEPPTEALPSERRQTPHNEYAETGANDPYHVDKWHAERTRSIGIGVPKDDYPNTYQGKRE